MVEILLMMKRSTWRWETIKILNYDHFSRSKRAATSLCSFPSWKAKTRQNQPQQPRHRVRAQDWIQTQLQKQATSHVTAVNQVLKTQKTKKRKSLQSWFQTRQARRWTGNWCCSSPSPVLLLLPYLSYHIRWGLASIYINIRVSQSWKNFGSQKQTQICSIFHHHHIVSVTILVMLIFFQLITRHLSTSERGVRLSLTIPESGWRSNQGRQNQDHSYDHNEHHNIINWSSWLSWSCF